MKHLRQKDSKDLLIFSILTVQGIAIFLLAVRYVRVVGILNQMAQILNLIVLE